jgi:tRNA-specific 2-thiouridylase
MLSVRTIRLRDINWLGGEETAIDCAVKVRSMRPPVAARLIRGLDRMAEVELLSPEEAVAPGQACVFYEREGTRVLGGGWIAKAQAIRKAA